jgi:hypothetical protein
MRSLLAFALIIVASASAEADVRTTSKLIVISPGPIVAAPGHEAVENNCIACHSLDYPRTNAKFLDRKGWQTEIDKMIKVFGAEIAPQDAVAIVDYLTKNYGVGE